MTTVNADETELVITVDENEKAIGDQLAEGWFRYSSDGDYALGHTPETARRGIVKPGPDAGEVKPGKGPQGARELYAYAPNGQIEFETEIASFRRKSEPNANLGSVSISGTPDQNLVEVGGSAQTGADWTPLLQLLDDLDDALESVGTDRLREDLTHLAGQAQSGIDLGTALGNFSALENGRDTVATAGTAVQLNGGNALSVPDGAELHIVAPTDNTGSVYLGDSTVSSIDGYELEPGEQMPIPLHVDDVSLVFVDVDNAGDGVTWIVEQ